MALKTVGIIAAMDEEIESIKKKMEITVTRIAVGAEFYIGTLAGKNVALVKCGFGKVNAAICTQALIDLFAVDYVINTGVAGAVNRRAKIGDIIISTDAVQHDFDCTALGFQKGEIPSMNKRTFEADAEMIAAAEKAVATLGLGEGRNIYTSRIASGDLFVASLEKKQEIWEDFAAYCTEMEGAAIAQACTLNKIPFVIIRTISDNSDSDGDMDFNSFVSATAMVSQAITEKLVEYI